MVAFDLLDRELFGGIVSDQKGPGINGTQIPDRCAQALRFLYIRPLHRKRARECGRPIREERGDSLPPEWVHPPARYVELCRGLTMAIEQRRAEHSVRSVSRFGGRGSPPLRQRGVRRWHAGGRNGTDLRTRTRKNAGWALSLARVSRDHRDHWEAPGQTWGVGGAGIYSRSKDIVPLLFSTHLRGRPFIVCWCT